MTQIIETNSQLLALLLLALPVACISWTVTKEEIFREWRSFCERRCGCREACLAARKFFYAFTCEYCFSHWVAAGLVALLRFKLCAEGFAGYAIATFSLVALANLYMTLYSCLRLARRWLGNRADAAV